MENGIAVEDGTDSNSSRDEVYVDESDPIKPSFIMRSTLPSKRVPKDQQSLWNIIKSAIGKDLTRLTTPVVFNEPLSLIQRLAEYMENVYLLKDAAETEDSLHRLELVGAFAASTMTSQRLSKPFNPLLFETFELEKPELGFRFVSEQVSHHPPVSAFHASDLAGEAFELYGSVAPRLRFWGRSLEIDPHGHFIVKFSRWNEVYTWKTVKLHIYNIIMGPMYMAMSGTLVVRSHGGAPREFRINYKGTGRKSAAELMFHGDVTIDKKHVRAVYGNCCRYLATCPPKTYDHHANQFKKLFREHADKDTNDSRVVLIPKSKLLWRKFAMPPEAEEYYDFSYWAMLLNVPPTVDAPLPRTDVRHRPDIRHMENGEYDKAADKKKYLEEKQRTAAKHNPNRTAKWFELSDEDDFGRENHWIFTGTYWDRNFEDCVDIY